MTKEEVIISLGLDNAEMKTGLKGMNFLIHESVNNTLRSIKHLIGINMVDTTIQVLKLWNDISKKAAEIFYFVGQIGEKQREQRHKDYQDFLKAAEAEKKFNEERDKRNKEATEKIGELDPGTREQQIKALRDSIDLRGDRLDTAEKMLKIDKLMKEIQDETLKKEEKLAAIEKDRLATIKQQSNAAYQAESALDKAHMARREFTVEDLANSHNLQGSPWQRQAAQIVQLQQWARENAMAGFTGRSDFQQRRADQLMQDLKKKNPFLKDPMEDLVQKADEQNAKLQEMLTSGVAIRQPSNVAKTGK